MVTTTKYVWDPVFDCVTHELDENNAVKAVYHNEPQQYGGVLSQRRGNTSHYHHYDALGSTRFLTDSTGNVTDTYLNDAWGNSVASTGPTVNPFRWVGKYGYYTDNSTGQVYVRARTYQPVVARWRSVDPVWHELGDLQLYNYVSTSPAMKLDPSGWWHMDAVNPLWYKAEFGDRDFESLVREINPRIDATANKVCIIPISGVDEQQWQEKRPTICGVYSIEALVPRKGWADNKLRISVGDDPSGNFYITRATSFFGAGAEETGYNALLSMKNSAKMGRSPITSLKLIGHSWNDKNSIGGTNAGGTFGFDTIKSFYQQADNSTFDKIKGPFYWQSSLSRAMNGELSFGCWLAVDSDVYLVGCETWNFAGNFADTVLRVDASVHGTTRPTWAISPETMSWGTAVRRGAGGARDAVVLDPNAPKSTTPEDYLSKRFFTNTKGKM
jgi:RHS repeat-associated protein